MKNRIATTLILAILCTAVGAQTTGKSKANDQSDLENFRAMIQQHPRALAELKNNPSVVSTPEFASEYRAVGQYLAEHPQVKDQVRNQLKSNPKYFDGLAAQPHERGQGGQHRGGWRHWFSGWWPHN